MSGEELHLWNTLPGLGPKRREYLSEIGVENSIHLLLHYPKRYVVQHKLEFWPKDELPPYDVMIDATVTSSGALLRKKKMTMVRLSLVDANGQKFIAIWFNQPYRKNQFAVGSQIWVLGKCQQKGSLRSIVVQQCGFGTGVGGIKAIYDLPQGITQSMFRQWLVYVLETMDKETLEIWPEPWRKRIGLSLLDALGNLHFPKSAEELQKAQQRVLLEETLILQLIQQPQEQKAIGFVQTLTPSHKEQWDKLLPFTLTGAQARAIEEIRADMSSSKPMMRFVQGDVGSGKTIVAIAALWQAVTNGHQAVFLAPTEILARQHTAQIRTILPQSIPIYLVTGRMSVAEREVARAMAEQGQSGIWIGTHALLSDHMHFPSCSLLVIDEQHRFGVMQRRKLLEQQIPVPDVLSLSATPIPRSLAMLLYGDMQASQLDELPPHRLPIKTVWIREPDRVEKLMAYCSEEMQRGHSVYWVCPGIQSTEDEDASVPTIENRKPLLQRVWPAPLWTVLHGQMKQNERQQIMERFEKGELRGLLATTIIEVGVDQANATVMVVEGADRFGLAQLHQLRGRVGRSHLPSYCALITNGEITATAEQRMKALCATQDGFYLSQLDLELRGPGEIFGTDQSGFSDLLVFRWQVEEDTLRISRECIDEWKSGKVIFENERWERVLLRWKEKPNAS